MTPRTLTMLVVCGALLATACDSDDKDDSRTQDESPIGSGNNTGSNGNGNNDEKDAAVNLSDAEIVAVMSAANEGEVAQGREASMRVRDTAVKEFATMMVTMHTAADERADQVAKELNLEPKDNDVSKRLKQDADDALSKLRDADVSGVDRIYMAQQVDAHAEVLKLLDDTLLPTVEADALETDLKTAREDVSKHLEKAKQVLADLDKAP